MAKNKRTRRKGSLLPLIAVGIGVYLLTRPPRVTQTIPTKPSTLPNSAPVIQRIWPRRIPQYL